MEQSKVIYGEKKKKTLQITKQRQHKPGHGGRRDLQKRKGMDDIDIKQTQQLKNKSIQEEGEE